MAETAQFNGTAENIESNVYKVDSFDESISENAAKQQYPSVKCLKDMVHIVESGTSGIWSYRKWSDGTAECWGEEVFNVPSAISANNYSTHTIDLPDIFISRLKAFLSPIAAAWRISKYYDLTESSEITEKLNICYWVDTDTAVGSEQGFAVMIKGRWK